MSWCQQASLVPRAAGNPGVQAGEEVISQSNVMSRMNKDLEAFLPEVKKWALEQQVNHKQTQARSAPKI